jgi:hypothetical protein
MISKLSPDVGETVCMSQMVQNGTERDFSNGNLTGDRMPAFDPSGFAVNVLPNKSGPL